MTALNTRSTIDALPSEPRVRDLRTLRRRLAAVGLLVPATAVALNRPFGVDDTDTRSALDAIAADPGRQATFTLLGFLCVLTIVPAFLTVGRVAARRRPVWAFIAVGVNLVAYLGGFAMFAIDSLYLAGGGLPESQRDGAAALIDAYWSTGVSGISTGIFVLGHVLGAILMGLALRGSIPTIGWVAMLLSQPAHAVAFVVLQNPVVDMFAWGLMALAFAVCARVVLRTPDDEWDVGPAPVR